MNEAAIEVGDILLTYKKLNEVSLAQYAVTGLKYLTILPAIASVATRGNGALLGHAKCNHALLVCAKKVTQLSRAVQVEGKVAHANAKGAGQTYASYLENWGVEVQAFRPRNLNAEALAQVGQVACAWASDILVDPILPYAAGKAVASAFRSSSYGSGAKQRARLYRQHKETKGGPPAMHDENAHKSMFCSMFVVAVYQAALSEAATETYMALDAKNTTPMCLDGYLRNNTDQWEQVNVLEVK